MIGEEHDNPYVVQAYHQSPGIDISTAGDREQTGSIQRHGNVVGAYRQLGICSGGRPPVCAAMPW